MISAQEINFDFLNCNFKNPFIAAGAADNRIRKSTEILKIFLRREKSSRLPFKINFQRKEI